MRRLHGKRMAAFRLQSPSLPRPAETEHARQPGRCGRSRAATTGLALGWLALLAPLVAHVIALRDAVPGHVGSTFIAGCLVAGLTVVALLTWASVARPAEPPPRTAAERRAREDTEPLEL